MFGLSLTEQMVFYIQIIITFVLPLINTALLIVIMCCLVKILKKDWSDRNEKED